MSAIKVVSHWMWRVIYYLLVRGFGGNDDSDIDKSNDVNLQVL